MMEFSEPSRWLIVLSLLTTMLIVARLAKHVNRPTCVPIPEPNVHVELREEGLEGLMFLPDLSPEERLVQTAERTSNMINVLFESLIRKRKCG